MRFLLFIAFIIVISGCNTFNDQNQNHAVKSNENEVRQIKASDPGDLSIQPSATSAKEIISAMKEIKMVRAVDLDPKLFVALELKHQYTFRSQKIVEEIKKKLDEEMPTKEIKVTTDHKMFIELEKLEEKIQNKEINKNDLNKELQKLKDLNTI